MAKPTRRDFLKMSAAAVGSAALARLLAACGQAVPPASAPSAAPISPTSPPPGATAREQPTPTVAPSTPTPWNGPDIAVARNGSPEQMVRRAIAALGGMGMFVSKGANVVVKPNICIAYSLPEFAATTNPWVVGTLVKMCFEAGAASVKVMDYPFNGTQDAAYSFSGIKEQVEAAGGQMAPMPMFKFVETAIPGGLRLKRVNLFEDIRKADVVINVPIGKVHSLSRLTLGMKNLLGVVKDRSVLHGHLSQNLADLASLVKPRLTVIDAVRIMVSNGPTGGSLDDVKTLNTVVASPDIVAADSYGATLFGLRPDDLGYVTAATAMRLGRSDLQNMKIEQIDVGTA
ncbi:MAG TPA: DUF362 domain-containing protein [Anaerolineales bacterium]